MATLFAWACPAVFTSSPVDHTWVTAYDNRALRYATIDAVKESGAEFWYCWGDYHSQGISSSLPKGLLGLQEGEPSLARCVAVPNARAQDDDAAKGTISAYGIDGVCHQAANQVLSATAALGAAPLTVRAARGYWLSDFFWGTYGRNKRAWRSRADTCAIPAKSVALVSDDPEQDLFAQRARVILARQPDELSTIQELRVSAQDNLASKAAPLVPVSAEAINDQNWAYLREAASVLGADRFTDLFKYPAGVRADLVDPAAFDAQR